MHRTDVTTMFSRYGTSKTFDSDSARLCGARRLSIANFKGGKRERREEGGMALKCDNHRQRASNTMGDGVSGMSHACNSAVIHLNFRRFLHCFRVV